MNRSRTFLGIGAVVVLGSLLGVAQITASCTYTTFQYPGAVGTRAYGINSYNSVVGVADANGTSFPFIRWSNGTYTKLNAPAGTIVLGRNDKGVTVGYYPALNSSHGLIITGSNYQKVDYPGQPFTTLLGINNYGSAVGAVVTSSNVQYGFKRWANGSFVKIQYPNSNATQINGINDSGVMVGMDGADAGPNTMIAFALINGKFQQITDPKADSLSTWVSGISNNQVIVGTGYNGGKPPTSSHGFFIVNGQVKEMPTPSGANNLRANGINNNGVIVGFGGFSGKEKAFIARCK
jgi:hypothetical protein